jgi:trans-aconitate methyltransferase
MEYKDDFFENYRRYLEIPEVRVAHDRVMNMLSDMIDLESQAGVTDMGCGTAEFGRFCHEFRICDYHGFDLDITRVDLGPPATIQVGDYTEILPNEDNVVVSLFATEIHLPWKEHERLYRKWFRECNVPAILVAGFYYEHCPDQMMIKEHTGYTVYQTRPTQPLLPGELRVVQQVPAGMFVDPFVEVWRLLTPDGYAKS